MQVVHEYKYDRPSQWTVDGEFVPADMGILPTQNDSKSVPGDLVWPGRVWMLGKGNMQTYTQAGKVSSICFTDSWKDIDYL